MIYKLLDGLIERERELIIVEYFSKKFNNENGLQLLKLNSCKFIYGWLVCYFEYVLKFEKHTYDYNALCSYVHDKIFDFDYLTAGANYYV